MNEWRVVVGEAGLWVIFRGTIVTTETNGTERTLDKADVEGLEGIDGVCALRGTWVKVEGDDDSREEAPSLLRVDVPCPEVRL